MLGTLAVAAFATPTAVVVGAGAGGLFAAARLARSGVETTLVEKNERRCAGGRLGCETLTTEGGARSFRFETGPSLLLLPSVYRRALKEIRAPAELQLARVRPSYAVHFSDGLPTPLELGGDAAAEAQLAEEMERAEPGAYEAYRAYLDGARANLDAGLPIFIREDLGLKALGRLPRFLRAALLGNDGASPLRDWPLGSHAEQLDRTFAVQRHKDLASFQDLYIGLPPADAPAVFSLLQAIEVADADAAADLGDGGTEAAATDDAGIFYPIGGWGAVRDALLGAAEVAGVRVRWGHAAQSVVVEDGRVTGVRIAPTAARQAGVGAGEGEGLLGWDAQGRPAGASVGCAPRPGASTELLPADCVVVNADVATAEPTLLPATLRRSEYAERSEAGGLSGWLGLAADLAARAVGTRPPRRWRYSSSSMSFFFALGRRYEQLRHHNVFIGNPSSWDEIFDATHYGAWGARAGPLHFYVHAPARTDESAVSRPTDDAVMVLVPTPPLDERLTPEEAEAATGRARVRVRTAILDTFKRAGMSGFEEAILAERVRSPLGWRDAYGCIPSPHPPAADQPLQPPAYLTCRPVRLRRGAIFGLSHNLDQLSFFRPGRRHGAAVRGLHWVGASTTPGNGVPLVLIGAQKAAAEALAELEFERPAPARDSDK